MTTRRRLVVVTALCVATLAATTAAPAATAAPPVTSAAEADRVGQAALALIDYPWQELGWTIEFHPGRSGFLGLAVGPDRRIEIYVRPHHTVTDVAHTVAHELGHAVDMTYGTPYRRKEYLRMRGFDTDRDWFGCDSCSDYATPAGDFAEVFEYWLLGGGSYQSRLGGPPDAVQLDHISTLFVEPFEPSVRVFWRQRWQPTS